MKLWLRMGYKTQSLVELLLELLVGESRMQARKHSHLHLVFISVFFQQTWNLDNSLDLGQTNLLDFNSILQHIGAFYRLNFPLLQMTDLCTFLICRHEAPYRCQLFRQLHIWIGHLFGKKPIQIKIDLV